MIQRNPSDPSAYNTRGAAQARVARYGEAIATVVRARVPQLKPTVLVTAGVSAVAAPFGGHAVNLAAISAALRISPS